MGSRKSIVSRGNGICKGEEQLGTFEERAGGLWDLELGEGWGEWPAMSLEKPMGTLSGDEFDFGPILFLNDGCQKTTAMLA